MKSAPAPKKAPKAKPSITDKYENWRIRTLNMAATEVVDVTTLAPPPPVAGSFDSIILYCTNPVENQNKEYRMRILQHDDGVWYFVESEYGARGAKKLKKFVKIKNVSYRQAKSAYDDIVREKRREGYTTDVSGRA